MPSALDASCIRCPILRRSWRPTIRANDVRATLRGYYRWYRETEPMAQNIQRDRGAVPALDSLMQRTADARLDQLADALAAGFGVGDGAPSTHSTGTRLLDLAPPDA